MKQLVLAALVGSFAGLAFGEDFQAPPVNGVRAMLYFQKSFGGSQQTSPTVGFRLDTRAPTLLGNGRSLPLMDLRLQGQDRYSMRINGAVMFDSSDSGSEPDSLKNPWFWGGVIVLGGMAISCASDHWPCHRSGDNTTDSSPTTATPGS
jgi:hypothetical protein